MSIIFKDLSFAAAETLEHTLSMTHMDPKAIIFRLKEVPFMDITGLQTFQEIIEQFHSRSIDVLLCEANSRVQYKLEKWIFLNGFIKARHSQLYLRP